MVTGQPSAASSGTFLLNWSDAKFGERYSLVAHAMEALHRSLAGQRWTPAGAGVFDDEADGLELTAEAGTDVDAVVVHAQDFCSNTGSRIVSVVRRPIRQARGRY